LISNLCPPEPKCRVALSHPVFIIYGEETEELILTEPLALTPILPMVLDVVHTFPHRAKSYFPSAHPSPTEAVVPVIAP
jgi:hypothetical protein